jgi:hypothetical protein
MNCFVKQNSHARAWRQGMRTGSLVAAAWLALLSAGTDEAQAAKQAPALAFVTGFRIGSNLPSFALSAANQTETYRILVSALGAARARQLVEAEVALLVPRYQHRWDLHLAAVYNKHFSTEELLSLTTQGPRSQYTIRLATLQPLIGNEIREASQDLLQEILKHALQQVLMKLRKTTARPADATVRETSF